jgi:outer membrane lipoprotein carrier protein
VRVAIGNQLKWLVVLALIAPLAASAQAPPSGAFPLTAKVLAAKVDAHYGKLRSLSVQFVEQYDGMGLHRQESGTLLLRKPDKMRWTYTRPAGKLFILDGHDAYFYSPGDSEVPRVPAKKLDDLRSPLRLLLGHTGYLAKEISHLEIAPSGSGYLLTGIPKGMEKRVQGFSVMAHADGTITGMSIEETDGARTSFSFSGEQASPPAPDSEFVFKAPPGVTIVPGEPPV